MQQQKRALPKPSEITTSERIVSDDVNIQVKASPVNRGGNTTQMKDQDADESQGEIKENEMLVKRYKGGQGASPLG